MLNKTRLATVLLGVLPLITLTACQSQWVDTNEGEAVNAAIYTQSVYPDGRKDVPTKASGLDGVSAKATIDNYQRSFVTPITTGSPAPAGVGAASAPSTGASPF